MARKSRRSRRKRVSRKAERAATTQSPMVRSETAPAAEEEATPAQGLAEQYTYVYDDLRRIAVLAGTLFAVLVALSFVIG